MHLQKTFLRIFVTLAMLAAVLWTYPARAQPASPTLADLVNTWLVTVQGDVRQRTLKVMSVRQISTDTFQADGSYGWIDAKQDKVQLKLNHSQTGLEMRFTTPANSVVVASQQSDSSFSGTITFGNDVAKPVMLRKVSEKELLAAQPPAVSAHKTALQPINPSRIRFIHMGGNDCPPCLVWRGVELPKLEKSEAFRQINFSYVTKAITSPIPSEIFLPAKVKPLKTKLDHASGGTSGSPHQVLLVDDEVYDYWFGARDAQVIEAKIAAIISGTKYPDRRCTRRASVAPETCSGP
ncbi:MAG: hypothetical protein H7228_01235 [Polaromonas sp.]|nr:hypothetical protein [Polaromonas sp.]